MYMTKLFSSQNVNNKSSKRKMLFGFVKEWLMFLISQPKLMQYYHLLHLNSLCYHVVWLVSLIYNLKKVLHKVFTKGNLLTFAN